jgi:hypothetical protein
MADEALTDALAPRTTRNAHSLENVGFTVTVSTWSLGRIRLTALSF